MMKKGWTHILFLFLVMLTAARSLAQVSVRANADRDKILIGEPVAITVEAYVPLGTDVHWFPADSIEHFTITGRTPLDTAANIDGKKIIQTLTITSFDSGRWTLPPFEISVDGKPYFSDSMTIDVAFLSFDPKEDYHDIKDIILSEETGIGYVPWLIAGIALLALVLFYFLSRKFRKAKPVPVAKPVPRISSYEKAMKALAELRQTGSAGNEKAYYSTMNDVLREYVSDKFGISTFERTNEELIIQLSALDLPKKSFDSLVHSLRISDFVKFARYRPTEEDNLANLDTVRSSIDLLNNYSGRAV